MGGRGPGAPGGPVSSPTFYRVHSSDLSPRSSLPNSPSPVRITFKSSSSFSSRPSSADELGMFLHPDLLVDKAVSELPPGVDPSQREDHLSDLDFERLLGTSRSDFMHLPKWRQNDLKKKAGLF